MPPDPYHELFERSADAILIIDGETFVDCNQATVDMLRYRNKEELLSTHPSELSPPTQPDGRSSFDKANEMIAKAFEKGSHRFEWHHKKADGEVFPVEVLLTAVEGEGEPILHVVWRDITERKRLESHLRHAQKMEAIGQLAGGVAHDFNNLLVAILGHSDLLRNKLQDRQDLVDHLEEIRAAGERAAGLVSQLLAFSRNQELRPRVLDLNVVLEDLDRLLRRLIGENIHLTTSTAKDPVWVQADPSQLEQVILNLATNARDAMPQGGTLSIEISRTETRDDGVRALISVSDTGMGMDDSTIQRAFDPFFTTKEMGKGTGLGLATVHGIVKQSGGHVSLDSSPGKGTTIGVFLPVVMSTAFSGALGPTELPTEGGKETILLAEDEDAVSNLMVRVLRDKGYEVLPACHGEEALRIWHQRKDDVDLLLTDVVMPEMGGADLAQELRRSGFKGPILLASGYTNDALSQLTKLDGEIDLLEKPFVTEELVGRVRLALDRV